ncbi:MAG: bifunctional adenosylcobinamide kinase/adenosylcobinamide-phosphate guanylyltransferase [Bacillota bacterium]|nr:bifunctional adenosylcobinamide kinase/adenosylcobinamide-phosphate guanylyltransferase [Bacillota bacterium]MDI3317481.1 bifunctional adenosylcobinamide kinase/adenosylcobinamide-phosphate guanylyltransferase [Bacillota bacterium]
MFTLVVGARRSGKSTFAERLAACLEEEAHLPVTYVATARPDHPEMLERIRAHRARRPPAWETLEPDAWRPEALPAALESLAQERLVLLDEASLWVATCLDAWAETGPGAGVAEAAYRRLLARLVRALAGRRAPAVVVSGEAGAGIVPPDPGARRFVDWLGRLNQELAAEAGRVVWMVAGLPLAVKGELPECARAR